MDYAMALMSGFKISLPTRIFFENHNSSHLDTSFISDYIASEQAAGRYSEGYDPDALEAIIKPFRTSPLGLVPKPHSDSLCLVQDIRYLTGLLERLYSNYIKFFREDECVLVRWQQHIQM
jgi:hypothetical protein